MNEIERIIEKGVVTSDYIKPEYICDFYVDEQRKKLWALSIDLLLETDKVCKKHNIRYCMAVGTLLGTIRHHGFVPWDDDIDIFMPRNDFERFIKLTNEFSSPYFLQTPYTDPGYYYTCARVRNSNTTYIVNSFRYQNFNHGIYISIFPIENWVVEGGEEIISKIKALLRQETAYMRLSIPEEKRTELDRQRISEYTGRNPLDIYEEIHRLASQYKDKETDHCAQIVNTVYPLVRNTFHKEDFKQTVLMDFDGYKFPVPIGYDRILTCTYGNYMEFPPKEQRGQWHTGVFIDPDKPYEFYINQL